MAYQQILTGFEGGDFTGLTTTGGSITPGAARSGAYGLHAPAAASSQYGCSFGLQEYFAAYTKHAAYLQFWVRFNGEPTAASDKCMFGGFGDDLWVWVEGNGALGLNTHRWGITAAGFGSQTMGLLPLGAAAGWYRVILKVWSYNDTPAGPNVFGVGHRICTALITQVNAANQLTFIDSASMGGINNFTTIQPAYLGGKSSVGASTTWDLDFDDAIYLESSGADVATIGKWNDPISGNVLNTMNLGVFAPTYGSIFYYDHILLLPIIAQGGYDQFQLPSDYPSVNEIPMGMGSVVGDTPGKTTTYQHAVVASAYREVEAYVLRVNATASLLGTHAILGVLPGGAPQPPLLTTPYQFTTYTQAPSAPVSGEMAQVLSSVTGGANENSPAACVVATGYRGRLLPVPTFNALEMGLRVKVAGTITLKNLFIEALVPTLGKDYRGPGGPFPPVLPPDDVAVAGPAPALAPDDSPGFPPGCNASSCKLTEDVAADSGGGLGCNTDLNETVASGGCPV